MISQISTGSGFLAATLYKMVLDCPGKFLEVCNQSKSGSRSQLPVVAFSKLSVIR